MSLQVETGHLHWRPLCRHVNVLGVIRPAIALQKIASETAWHGRVVRFISRALLVAGAFLTVPIALIEGVAFLIIGLLGLAINRFLCQNRSEWLQKYSLKTVSYSLHSFFVGSVSFLMALKPPDLKIYTAAAAADHLLHLGSAISIQLSAGAALDRAAGRPDTRSTQRVIGLFVDSHFAGDIIEQFQRDFAPDLRGSLIQNPNIPQYLAQRPEERAALENFNLARLLQDADYRRETLRFVQRFINSTGIITVIDENNAESRTYQNRVSEFVQTSFLEIHRDANLFHWLDREEETGQSLLESLDASIYTPLATYAQYKEVLEPIQCPGNFGGNRQAQLLHARRLVEHLSPLEKRQLVEKILGAEIVVGENVRDAYREIGTLAVPMYQGSLLKQRGPIDLADPFAQRNLFQDACQRALEELQPVV